MSGPSYRRHRFPAAVIQQAVWLYFRFPLSLRDDEDMLSQRGIDVSYETVRRWSFQFSLANARKLRSLHPRADTCWHFDEVFLLINSKNVYLWRAVDCEGEVLDVLVQSHGNKRAALNLMRKLLKSSRLLARRRRDRQTAIIWRVIERTWDERSPHNRRSDQQPGREFASPGTAARTTDATLQVRRFGATIPVHICSAL